MWSNLMRAATERVPTEGWGVEEVDPNDPDEPEEDDLENEDEVLASSVDDESQPSAPPPVTPAPLQQQQQQPPPSSSSSSRSGGGGAVFMGRLSRFLEQVTSPDGDDDDDDAAYYESEDQESGWDEDEGLLENINVDADQQQETAAGTATPPPPESPQQEPQQQQPSEVEDMDVFLTPDHSEDQPAAFSFQEEENAPVVPLDVAEDENESAAPLDVAEDENEPASPLVEVAEEEAPVVPMEMDQQHAPTTVDTDATAAAVVESPATEEEEGWGDPAENLENVNGGGKDVVLEPPASEAVQEEAEGWGEEDDIEFSENNNNNETVSEPAAVVPAPPTKEPALVVEGEPEGDDDPQLAEAGGWDEDDDLEFSENNNNVDTTTQPTEEAAPTPKAPALVVEGDEPEGQQAGGWDEDEDIEFSESNNVTSTEDEPAAPPQQQPDSPPAADAPAALAEEPATTSTAAAAVVPEGNDDEPQQQQASGWDDDDVDIEFSEHNNTTTDETAPQQQEEPLQQVAATAAVPMAVTDDDAAPLVDEPAAETNKDEQQQQQASGWDDDDVDNLEFSENNDAAVVATEPTPPAVATESSPLPVTDEPAVETKAPVTETESPPLPVSDQPAAGGDDGGWDDDVDDLEFSENNATPDEPAAAAVTETASDTASPMDHDGDDVEEDETESSLEKVVLRADNQLQAVMQEIDDQQHQSHGGSHVMMVADDEETPILSDEEHAQAAVLEIQQEMKRLSQSPQHQQPLPPQEQQQRVVDHTPLTTDAVVDMNDKVGGAGQGGNEEQDDPSMVVLATLEDRSRDTGPLRGDLSDEQDVYDDENEMAYGPVVDYLPSKLRHSAGTKSSGSDGGDENVRRPFKLDRADSLKVQALDASSEFDDDDDDDKNETSSQPPPLQEELVPLGPTVVDHTPTAAERSLADRTDATRRVSMGVLAESEVDTLDAEDEFEEDNLMGMDDTDNSKDSSALAVGVRRHRPGVRPSTSTRSNFGPMVDHTPADEDEAAVAPPPASGSMAVNADALEEDFQQDDDMDETHYGDNTTNADAGDGWDDDDDIDLDVDDDDENGAGASGGDGKDDNEDKDESSEPTPVVVEQKLTFFTPETDHVVDHTPSDDDDQTALTSNNMDPSIVVLVPDQDDLTRDTGNGRDEEVYDDENEEEYGLVVDHTPQTPATSNEQGAPNMDETGGSLLVHASALKKDIEEDEKMDESCFGDSTLDDGLAAGEEEDGWGHDDPVLTDDNVRTTRTTSTPVRFLEATSSSSSRDGGVKTAENDMAVVDHTPSEMVGDSSVPPVVSDPSVDVVASEGNTKDAGDDDGDVVYGPVVDHTPTTPAPTEGTRSSDSIVVQAADLATVDDDDETTMVGTSTVGDVTVDEDIHQAAPAQPVRSPEDQMVDHVPPRPESRFGDASTLVAADPSEVLSEVDDMTQEGGGNFGPVVDQTPPPQPEVNSGSPGQPSGAGSTVVFAPSVQVDDLDDPDETEEAVDDEDNSGWAAANAVEATPNPQSGNDEPVTPPVVDVIPPENEVEVVAPGGLSEITVGGTQSLLQTEDPKEDDFGPVVDQIPDGRSAVLSQASMATQLTASECRALERDDAAAAAAVGEVSVGSVSSPKAEIVVDQLPQPQDKMTADSLATIGRSQFSEDAEEEDDSKFGPVVDHLPTPVLSTGPSRGGSTVDALGTVSEANSDVADGDGWDDDDVDFDVSESNLSDGAVLATPSARPALRQPSNNNNNNETPSDQERSMSVRFDSSVNASSAPDLNGTLYYDPESGVKSEATKYFDPDSGSSSAWGDAIADLDNSPRIAANKSFAEADTPPSTPYRRSEAPSSLLPVEEDTTDSTKPISMPAIAPTNEQQQQLLPLRCGRCEDTRSTECPCVQKFLKANDSEGSLVGTMMTPEGKSVEVDFSKLLQEEMAKRKLIEEECKALRARLGAEISSSPVKPRKISLPPRLPDVGQGDADLRNRVVELESDCAGLRDRNENLSKSLAAAESTVKMLEIGGANLGKEGNLENEFLRDAKDALSKQVLDLETRHEEELQQQYQLLDKKSSDVRALETAKVTLEKEKTSLVTELKEKRKLANQAESLATELLAVAEERDSLQESLETSKDAIKSLQDFVDEHGMEQEALQTKRASEIVDLKQQVKELTGSLSVSENAATSLREECVSLVNEKNDLSFKLSEAESAGESLQALVDSARSDAEREASNAQGLVEELNKVKEDLVQVSSERDQTLADKEKANSHLAELGRTMKQMHEQADERKEQISELENSITQKEAEAQTLSSERDALVNERDELSGRCQELQSSWDADKADFDKKMEESSRQLAETLANANRDQEQLKEQRLALKLVEEELEAQRARMEEILEEQALLNEDNEEMLVQLGFQKQQMDNKDERNKTLEEEIRSLHSQIQDVEAKDQEIDLLRQDAESLREQVVALTEGNSSLSSRLTGLEGEHRRLGDTCRQLESHLSDLRQQLQADEAAKRSLRDTVRSLEVAHVEKDKAIASRDAELEHLESRMATMVDRSERLQLKNELAQTEENVFHQAALVSEMEKKCESLMSELNDTKARVAAAESVPDLQKQVESLGDALKATRSRLSSKEEEVDRLAAKLVSLGSSTENHPEAAAVELADISEGGDDLDSLKSKVVSLAVALERSENKRAQAIERLQSERLAHNESLRRLTESLKRYYSAVSISDGA